MSDKKKIIVASITLGAIAAVSGGLIGLTNLITKDAIAQNSLNKIKEGLVEIYGENTVILKEKDINDGDKYLDKYYEIGDESQTLLGYVFKTTGSNMYGKISLLVGVSLDFEEGHIYIITNEQTYAQTLMDNYVNLYNKGKVDIDDVSCGATYGAKLIRDMINEATSWAENNLSGGGE